MPTSYRTIPPLTPEDIARFWSKVDKTPGLGPDGECWEWQAYRQKTGYGMFGIGNEVFGAHRISVVISLGTVPETKLVCHSCDNPPCVNPSHLRTGTHLDNAADSVTRDRHPMGERCTQAKLAAADVLAIRIAYAAGDVKQEGLAVMYGVSSNTIRAILRFRTWRHIGGPCTLVEGRDMRAKLSRSDVSCIRTRYASGNVSYSFLVREYGVSLATIAGVITRRYWKHVP